MEISIPGMLPAGNPITDWWRAASLCGRRQGLRLWWSLGLGHCEKFLGHSRDNRPQANPACGCCACGWGDSKITIEIGKSMAQACSRAVLPLNYMARKSRRKFFFYFVLANKPLWSKRRSWFMTIISQSLDQAVTWINPTWTNFWGGVWVRKLSYSQIPLSVLKSILFRKDNQCWNCAIYI